MTADDYVARLGWDDARQLQLRDIGLYRLHALIWVRTRAGVG